MNENNENTVYVISCHNEWCSGPETVKVVDELTQKSYRCPVCGWTALMGSGITEIKRDGGNNHDKI